MDEPLLSRLWVYTNYDCNLSCSYCLARSSPQAERRAVPLPTFYALIDEAVSLGCRELFLTGGEPALLPDIYAMLAYACPRLPTVMLTNGMLWKGARLARLEEVRHPNLALQISLDSATPDLHDYSRGPGTWAKSVEGIKTLTARGFRVRIGATTTMHSKRALRELEEFLTGLNIPREDWVIRPVAKRGFSRNGERITLEDLLPELTVDRDGVYWHPVSTDEDMRISTEILPLLPVVEKATVMLHELAGREQRPRAYR